MQHFFLQRLPFINHVRSIYIPHVADHPHGVSLDPRELALQIVDIVALRPDIELCYVGIANKCFEILENKHSSDTRPAHDAVSALQGAGTVAPHGYMVIPGGSNEPLILDDEGEGEDEDNEGEGDADADDDEDDADDVMMVNGDDDVTPSESEEEVGDDSDDSDLDDVDGEGGTSAAAKRAPKLRLREILFYDDKVAVFRARHGRL
ncbi:MAG: hypothetical protein INR71_10955 [Terriglobus roseus]|nr:hypothetical protein [Terriglobus roseus]